MTEKLTPSILRWVAASAGTTTHCVRARLAGQRLRAWAVEAQVDHALGRLGIEPPAAHYQKPPPLLLPAGYRSHADAEAELIKSRSALTKSRSDNQKLRQRLTTAQGCIDTMQLEANEGHRCMARDARRITSLEAELDETVKASRID